MLRFVPRRRDRPAWYSGRTSSGPTAPAPAYAALVAGAARERAARHRALGDARQALLRRARSARGGHLVLIAMRSADEVVGRGPARTPPRARPSSAAERELAEQLVAALDAHFDPAALRDEYRERVLAFIAAKAKGRRVAVAARGGAEAVRATSRARCSRASQRREEEAPCRVSAPSRAGKRGTRSAARRREAPVARGVWSGSISFGLVTIPVELFSASRRSRRGDAACSAPTARRSRGSTSAPTTSAARRTTRSSAATRVEDGKFVVVTRRGARAARAAPLARHRAHPLRRSRRASIPSTSCVPTSWCRAGSRPRRTVCSRRRWRRSGRAAIASFVMRGKAYAVAIFADRGVLRAETLRFGDELRATGSARPAASRRKATLRRSAKLKRAIAKLAAKRRSTRASSATRRRERLLALRAREAREGQGRREGAGSARG